MNPLDRSRFPVPTESWALKTLKDLPKPPPIGWLFWPTLLVGILLAVYGLTLLPGVGYGGDTAEFQFVGKVLGTSHATGYPTYLLINHVFTQWLPIGSQAWKANALSAALGALACLFLYRLLTLLDTKVYAAFVAALAFGLSATFWQQSLVAEVYTLNMLFVLAVLYWLAKWQKTKKDRYFYFAIAAYALSFGNHLTMALMLPAIVIFVLVTQPRVFISGRKILFVLAMIVLGAAQYLYLFWQMNSDGPYIYDQMNFAGFVHFVTGGEYGKLMFKYTLWQVLTQRLPMLGQFLWKEVFLLLPLAALGLAMIGNWRVHLLLLLCMGGNFVYNIGYENPDIYIFFLPLYLILFIYAGLGLRWLSRLTVRQYMPRTQAAFAVALILIPAVMLAKNWNASAFQNKITVNRQPTATGTDFRATVHHLDNTFEGRRVEHILDAIGKNGLIITGNVDWDWSNYFWYYLIGEGRGQRDSIYLVHNFRFADDHRSPKPESIQALRAYLADSQPFDLPQQRMKTPTGLKVYCSLWRIRYALDDAGFILTQTVPHLWRVTLGLDSRYLGPVRGWQDCQTLDGLRTDFYSKDFTLMWYVPHGEPTQSVLSLKLASVEKSRLTNIYLNNRLIYIQTASPEFTLIELPLTLQEGKNVIRFAVPDETTDDDTAAFQVQEAQMK